MSEAESQLSITDTWQVNPPATTFTKFTSY